MKNLIISLFVITSFMSKAQTIMPLYDGVIPNYIASSKKEIDMGNGRIAGITVPKLIVFLPQKKDSLKAAVIICPGGGYARLAMDNE